MLTVRLLYRHICAVWFHVRACICSFRRCVCMSSALPFLVRCNLSKLLLFAVVAVAIISLFIHKSLQWITQYEHNWALSLSLSRTQLDRLWDVYTQSNNNCYRMETLCVISLLWKVIYVQTITFVSIRFICVWVCTNNNNFQLTCCFIVNFSVCCAL